MHWIKGVSYLSEHKLKLKFEDGQDKIVDLKPHLTGKIFRPLTDIDYFRRVKLNKDIDTIATASLYGCGRQKRPRKHDVRGLAPDYVVNPESQFFGADQPPV